MSGSAGSSSSATVGATAKLISFTTIGYWFIFWSMNGLDKFLNRTDLGVITWYGKDRTEQFTSYFERMNIQSSLVEPVLIFAGIWELLIAIPLLMALFVMFQSQSWPKFHAFVSIGFALGAATLIAFSAFDVVAGDRAELREHGLYLILLLGCWVLTVWMNEPRSLQLQKDTSNDQVN